MVFAWIILSFIVAIIGNDRKIGYWGTLLLSLIFSPIVGALFAISSPRKLDLRNLKKCPYCAEYIRVDAVICKYCGRELNSHSDLDIERFRKF